MRLDPGLLGGSGTIGTHAAPQYVGVQLESAGSRHRGMAGLFLMLFACCILAALALVVTGIEPLRAVALVIGLGALLGATYSSYAGMAMLLVAVALFQREGLFAFSIPVFQGGIKPTDLLLGATLAGAAVRWLGGSPAFRPVPRSMLLIILGFVGWAVLSAGLGIVRGNYFKFSLLELRPLLQYLLIIPLIGEYSEVKLRRVLQILVVTGVLVAIRALILYANGSGDEGTFTGGAIRIMTVNFDAMLVALTLAVALAATGGGFWWLGPSALVLLPGLTVTFQRAAFLALLAGIVMLVVVLRGRPRRRMLLGFGLATAAAVALLSGSLLVGGDNRLLNAAEARIASIGAFNEDVSAGHRLREWSRALEMIRSHPLEGSGLGTEVVFESPMYDETTRKMGFESHDIYMHNSYLWMLVKMGLIGMALFGALLWLVLRQAVRQLRTPLGASASGLSVVLGVALLTQLVVSLFGPMFNVDDVAPFAVLIIGGILAVSQTPAAASSAGPASPQLET